MGQRLHFKMDCSDSQTSCEMHLIATDWTSALVSSSRCSSLTDAALEHCIDVRILFELGDEIVRGHEPFVLVMVGGLGEETERG